MNSKNILASQNIHNLSPQNLIQNNAPNIHGCGQCQIHKVAMPNLCTCQPYGSESFGASKSRRAEDIGQQQNTQVTEYQIDLDRGSHVGGICTRTGASLGQTDLAHQQSQPNVLDDVGCFRETQGRQKRPLNFTTLHAQRRAAAPNCQPNSANVVGTVGQQSGLCTSEGSTAHDDKCSHHTRKRGRPRKEMASKQVHVCGTADDVHNIGQPMSLHMMEGSTARDDRCSGQTRKRGRPPKEMASKQVHLCGPPHDVSNIDQPITVDMMEGSTAHDDKCSHRTRKRGRPPKEMGIKQVHVCGPADGVHNIGQPMNLDMMEGGLSSSLSRSRLQTANSHDDMQNVIHQPSLHETEETRKRKRRVNQASTRYMHKPNSSSHVDTIGEASIPDTTQTAISVQTDGQPSVTQNVTYQSQGKKRKKRTGQVYKTSVRRRSLTSDSHTNSDDGVGNIDEGSSSYTTQDTSPAYDDLGVMRVRSAFGVKGNFLFFEQVFQPPRQ